jgi:hypothetical protein
VALNLIAISELTPGAENGTIQEHFDALGVWKAGPGSNSPNAKSSKPAKRNTLYAFIKAVAPALRAFCLRSGPPLPYANLEIVDSAGRRRIKRHDIKDVKARR